MKGLINLLEVIFITAFIGTVIFEEGDLVKRQFLRDMRSLMSVAFLMYFFMNDFLSGWLFAVVVI